jgi:diguanylate cyclase (GGDEF)-like protein
MEALWRAFSEHEPNNRRLDRLRLVERLRERLMPAFASDPDRFRLAETAWLAARFVASSADAAAVIRHCIDTERDRGILDFINQELLLSQSTEDVLRVLNRYLGWLDIPSLYLLMEETPVPGERRKPIFAFTDFENIAGDIPESARLADVYRFFRARKSGRFDLIVTPLIVNEAKIGLAWFEPGRNSLGLVHSFALQIGKAFISIGMAEDTQRLVERLRREIELRTKKEAELAYYADIDVLTKLFNRRFFYDALAEMTTRERSFAIFYIDIDGFKGVNDTFGHQTGDALLVQIAGRLRNLLGESAVRLRHTSPDGSDAELAAIFRLGGDEFTALVSATDECTLKRLAKQLNQGLSLPYALDGHKAVVSASIGIGVYPDDSKDAQQLLHFADMALYAAKRERNRTRLYREIR